MKSVRGWALLALWLAMTAQAAEVHGLVRDQASGQPLAQATVVAGHALAHTDEQGRFSLDVAAGTTRISARALGYRRQELDLSPAATSIAFALQGVRPKALYLSVFGVGSTLLRGDALDLVRSTEINALVIDLKDDRGLVPYRSAALAEGGLVTQKIVTVADMPELVKALHAQGLYLIARIVVFKDGALASHQPQWAVHSADGELWHDKEEQAWIDPFHREAWAHSLGVAEEAAQLGFDEVQFDYLRFPDTPGLRFSQDPTEEARVATIGAFLDAARERLARYNVFVAADIFGYVAWNANDTHIGQQIEELPARVDYISLMLYPSGFSFGIPGHRDPVAAPFEIVDHTLRRAMERTHVSGLRFRPWLQAFKDYAFDRREFGEHEIRQQIDAAEGCGTDGWMLWNPRNRYEAAGLKERD